VARLLAQWRHDTRFHVVGGFCDADMDVSDLKDRITFYGPQQREFFDAFFPRMDLILSPNMPSRLAPGAFDGFPTGCCVEAGARGVAVFCTDMLAENRHFRDREDLVIIPPDPAEITRTVIKYFDDYESLHALGNRGQQTFRQIYSAERQIAPRLSVLAEAMGRV
jgi:glycosyltransferase involved in cell wall biosynthesis